MRNIILTLGILTALMPFLGFPGTVEDIFFVVAGSIIALAVYYGCGAVEAVEDKENHKIYNKKVVHVIENNEVKDITTKEKIYNNNV